jgi:hypothetical protein
MINRASLIFRSMDQGSHRDLRLALLRLLNLCRDAAARVSDDHVGAWLAGVEFYSWRCLEQHGAADPAQCRRILASCERILERLEHLPELMRDKRAAA